MKTLTLMFFSDHIQDTAMACLEPMFIISSAIVLIVGLLDCTCQINL